ncbi:MAG TPA: 50S ribosomal protein L11 methyltransferase [Ignavibacteriaceae bacterium]|nr:50S ribosomal protein L11 methyltransferase [Ignavibacteriaceae bacterium]
MKYYKEFVVSSEPFIPEIISSVLWQLEITGVSEEVNCIKVFAEGSSTLSSEDLSNELEKLVVQKVLLNYIVEENLIEDKNWNEEWEKSLNIIKVSDRIVVKPTFREYSKAAGEIVINIVPKMSFGTGEHQTTKLVIQLLEKYLEPGARLLDIGSGTGILSIVAVKLGAKSAIAVDNDEWCFENGNENCALNGVEEKIKIVLGEIKDIHENDFDLIAANIQKNILILIAEEIKLKMNKKGMVILSGLLMNDEEDIVQVYKKFGFELVEKKQMDEWISLVMKI